MPLTVAHYSLRRALPGVFTSARSRNVLTSCSQCPLPVVGRGLCAKHYNAWRKLNAPDPCSVCARSGGAGRATQRGLCGAHYGEWLRAGREQGGYRARPSQRAVRCHSVECTSAAEPGSWFCSVSCRASVTTWAPDSFTSTCLACLTVFSGQAKKKFCNPNCRSLGQHVRRKFGLTIQEYVARVRAPGVTCEICSQRPEGRWLVLDHDHATGALRGTLCDGCNRGIGHADDNDETLVRLRDYVLSQPIAPPPLAKPSKGTCRLCLGPCEGAFARRDYCGQRCYERSLQVSKYGLRAEEYRAWLEHQGHSCPGCTRNLDLRGDRSAQPNVDHCHQTGAVRGILCNGCNTCLGQFRDQVDLIESARDYLSSYSAA